MSTCPVNLDDLLFSDPIIIKTLFEISKLCLYEMLASPVCIIPLLSQCSEIWQTGAKYFMYELNSNGPAAQQDEPISFEFWFILFINTWIASFFHFITFFKLYTFKYI